jgi:hypothetical protein
MKQTPLFILLICGLMLPASAMANTLTSLGEEAIKIVSKTHILERVHSKAAVGLLSGIEKRAGNALSTSAEKLAARHGDAVLKVLSKEPRTLIPAIERFSPTDQAKLLDALAQKPALISASRKYGVDVLKLELRSHGQASAIIKVFGAEGLKLTGKLNDKQLMLLAQESARFNGASAKSIKEFLELAGKYTGKTFDWIDSHPRLLFAGLGAAVVVDLKAELLGNPETGTHGAVQQIADSGFHTLDSITRFVGPWGAGVLLIWLCVRSWIRRPRQPQPKPAEQQSKRFRFFRRKQDDDADAFIDVEPI